ncbi:MAG: YqgE/AlgH family protein [Alphaproteobacteria bacterium]|nr:YqgE/AlgH family protein [Alphaproteobacteria bacterium]
MVKGKKNSLLDENLLDDELLSLMDELDNLSAEEIEGIYNEIKHLRERKENSKRKTKIKAKKLKNDDEKSLLGKFLVYIGDASNELYDKAVVYITECDAENVRGIIINKQLFGSAAIEYKSNSGKKEIRNMYDDLYQGGPVSPAHGFVIFPNDDSRKNDPFSEVLGDVAISSSFGVLQEILEGSGPEKKIIAMGHCLWKRGELEWEIFNNKWLIVPSNLEILFDVASSERWNEAMKASGVEMGGFISNIVGIC